MNSHFKPEQIFEVLGRCNQAVLPTEIVLNTLVAVLLLLVYKRYKHAGKIVSLILAFFWG